jgi:hypothetical protein
MDRKNQSYENWQVAKGYSRINKDADWAKKHIIDIVEIKEVKS